jgi:hypothetical protein
MADTSQKCGKTGMIVIGSPKELFEGTDVSKPVELKNGRIRYFEEFL